MTRGHIGKPVWTWKCDRCGAIGGDLALTSEGLPAPDEMRNRGWYIADVWGDLCSRCRETPAIGWITKAKP